MIAQSCIILKKQHLKPAIYNLQNSKTCQLGTSYIVNSKWFDLNNLIKHVKSK